MLPNSMLRSVTTILMLGISYEASYGRIHPQVLAVPIEFSNGETVSSVMALMGTSLRKTLCQTNQTSPLYRYDREAKKCFEIGQRGPCGENMLFYSEENSSAYGECDCDYDSTNIPSVYHEPSQRCFFLFTKGYCDAEQWLVFDSNSKPKCEEDKCKEAILFGQTDTSLTVPFKERCVTLNSGHKYCKKEEVVTFKPDELFPSCGPKDSENKKILGTSVFSRGLKCRPGSRRDIRGTCRPVIKGF